MLSTGSTTRKVSILELDHFFFTKAWSISSKKETPKARDVESGRVVIIMADSLDSTIFMNQEILDQLPALKSLKSDSIHFDSFTASGHWTFPCVSSFISGLSPLITTSYLRVEPKSKYEKLDDQSKQQSVHQYMLGKSFQMIIYTDLHV